MACEYICDGCGKRANASVYPKGELGYHKPPSWFQRQDDDGIQLACSRECIGKIAKESGKTRCVLPI